jgi:glutamine phosphoribosylpyrophosphate amidotransferase
MATRCDIVGIASPGTPLDVSDLIGVMRATQRADCQTWGMTSLEGETLVGHVESGALPTDMLKPRAFNYAIGHVTNGPDCCPDSQHRYPGIVAQPILIESSRGECAISFSELIRDDAPTSSLYDIASCISCSTDFTWLGAIHNAVAHSRGAHTFIVLTRQGLFYAQDRQGLHPLAMNEVSFGGEPMKCVASKFMATHVLERDLGERYPEARIVHVSRNIRPGTIGCIRLDGSWTEWAEKQHIGLTRSLLDRQTAQHRCGQELAQHDMQSGFKFPKPNTIVVGCPRGGIRPARAYASSSDLEYAPVLRATTSVARSGSTPHVPNIVHAAQPSLAMDGDVAGKTVVLVGGQTDHDSVVRDAVRLLKDSGAWEVHVRVPAPASASGNPRPAPPPTPPAGSFQYLPSHPREHAPPTLRPRTPLRA